VISCQIPVLNRTPLLDGDYAVGRSSQEATDFAGSAARPAVFRIAITEWALPVRRAIVGAVPERAPPAAWRARFACLDTRTRGHRRLARSSDGQRGTRRTATYRA
jgi:hypothetical protein